jgi:hypothetical protein
MNDNHMLLPASKKGMLPLTVEPAAALAETAQQRPRTRWPMVVVFTALAALLSADQNLLAPNVSSCLGLLWCDSRCLHPHPIPTPQHVSSAAVHAS